MIVKQIVDEDFIQYKKPSMFIGFPTCSWKCEIDCGMRVCQNSALAQSPDIDVDIDSIIQRYLANPLTSAIVLGGLEPMDSFDDVRNFIFTLRMQYKCNDDVVIYTGYTKEECKKKLYVYYIENFCNNIIVKFGRFKPNQKSHKDEVLGVVLASDNQYGNKLC